MDMPSCTLGLMLLIHARAPTLEGSQRDNIAYYVCAAAQQEGIDPAILGAYMLNENSMFNMILVRPAATGVDIGLFQHNTRFNGGTSPENLQRLAHPFTAAVQAAKTIKSNIKRFGFTWQAFAAYWSPKRSSEQTLLAKEYFRKLHRHYGEVNYYLTLGKNATKN